MMRFLDGVTAVALIVAGVPIPSAAQEAKSGQAAVEESRGDAVTNPLYKGPEVLAFIGVKPGFRVVDIVAGRFTRAFSQQVGPQGKVYAVEPAEVVKVHPQVLGMMNGMAAQPGYGNVEVLTGPVGTASL